MSFSRYSLYGSDDDDLDPADTDFSGFLNADIGNQPIKPKTIQRPRTSKVSSVGYTVPNPIHEDPEAHPAWAMSPFWSHDNSLGGKIPAYAKTLGATGMLFSGTYAAASRKSGGSYWATKTFIASSALYVHPMLGVNHGLLSIVPAEGWLQKAGRMGIVTLTHGGTMYLFYKLLRA